MVLKIIKVLWVAATVFVLFITLNGYHSAHDKGIWDVLTWLMLILSFPAGLVVSLVLWALEMGFSITDKTSYFSLVVAWTAYFVLGYLQWFKLAPYLITKLRALRKKKTGSVKTTPA
jgi:hypothetical protein